MKVAIMQPYLFPYIGYWQLIKAVDVFVIYDDVNYIKGGWINRNAILENGKRKIITLETRGASQNKLINQILVGNNKESLIKTLTQNYQRAPYFKPVMGILLDLFRNDEKNLAKFISCTIFNICSYLLIDTKLLICSEVFNNLSLKGVDRIVNICKQLGADAYINAIGGIKMYDKSTFAKQDLLLYFIESNPIEYIQFGKAPFVPNLSIIDVMMFNSPEVIQRFLENYRLDKGSSNLIN